MKHTRRIWSIALVFSCLAVLFFLASPQFARALPPAGLRIWLFDTSTIDTSVVQAVVVIAHHPCDLGVPRLAAAGLPNTINGQACGGQNKTYQLSGPNDNGLLQTQSAYFSGDSVALTYFLWLKSGQEFNEADVEEVFAWLQYPHFGSEVLTDLVAVERFLRPVENLNPQVSNLPTLPDNAWYANETGLRITADRLENDAPGRPDAILSVVIRNLPDTTFQKSYTSIGDFYLRTAPDTFIHQSDWARTGMFTLKPRDQKVAVESGNGFLGDSSGNANLLFTNPQGQTVVSNEGITLSPCDTGGGLTCLGNHELATGSNANVGTARRALRQSLSKLAQETAVIHQNNGTAADRIKNWLAEPPSPDVALRYPRGQVLLVINSKANAHPPLAITGDVTVNGKKLVIFSGFSGVSFTDNVAYTDATDERHKAAFIVLSGNLDLGQPNGVGPVRYDGAYVALSLQDANPNQYRLTLGGSGNTATIYGLLVADVIDFSRQVPPEMRRAVINYDPSFQDGELIGLSPFVRPLVSEGGAR